MPRLAVGDTAPNFQLETTQGPLSLDELRAQAHAGVVVYFYPRAMTPGCTKEACDFRDSLNSLRAAGYIVLGVSADSMDKLEKFTQKEGLNFPLASDPNHEVMKAWGAWGEKKNYGKTVIGSIRSTVVVSPGGSVVLAQYGVKATGHVARLRKALGIDE